MRAHDVLTRLLHTSRFITERYLSDLSDEDLLAPPVPGSQPAAWQLGHLLCSECDTLSALGVTGLPALPEGFRDRHSKQGAARPGSEGFLPKAGYLELMRSVRALSIAAVGTLSEQQLDAPGPEAMRAYAPTVGDALLMIGSHEVMHSGQLAVLRRKLGKPVVI
jgi:hypothetical protein